MLQIDERIRAFDKRIDAIFKASEECQRIAKIPGVGPKDRDGHGRSDRRWKPLKMADITRPG
jgi:hypothetical protein